MKDKIVVTESKENLEGILNLRLIQIKDEDLSVDAKEAIAGYIEPLLEKWRQDIQEKDKMSKLEKEKEFNMCSDATVSINHREAGDVSKYDEDRAAGDVSKFEDVATGEVSMCEGRAAHKVSNYDNSHTSARSKLQGNQEFIVAPSKHVWTPSKTGVPVDPPKHVLKTDDEIEERVDEKKTVVSLLLADKKKAKTFSNMKGISEVKNVSCHGRRVNIIFKKTELALSFFQDVGKMRGHCVLLSLEELGIQHTPSITEEQMMRLVGDKKGGYPSSNLFDSREKMDVSTVDDKLIFSFESVDSANAFVFSKSCNKEVLNSLGQLKGTSLNNNEFTLEADEDGFYTLQGPLDKFQAELLGELNFQDFKITKSSDYKKVYISFFNKVTMFKVLLSKSARQMDMMLHRNHFVKVNAASAPICPKSQSVDVVQSPVQDIVKATLEIKAEKRKREEKSEAESEHKKARVDAVPYCLVCQQSGHEMSTKCATCLACGDKGHVRKDCDAQKVVKSEGENIEQNGHGKENKSSDKMEVNNDELKHEEDAEGNGITINKRDEDDSKRKRESEYIEEENDKTKESIPSSDAPRVDGSSSSPNDRHNEIEILHQQVTDCVKKRLDMYMVGQAGTDPKNIKIKNSDEYTRLAKFFSHKLRAQIKETYEQYNRTLEGVAITADNKEQIKVEIDMYFDTQPVVEDETDMQDVQPRTQEEQPLQRNNVHVEERQIFIKNFHSDFKTLKDAIKQHGRFDKINKVGQKMVIVTMKSTEGAALAIRNLQGQRIGKHIIKVGPYKTKEQLRKEKAEKEKEEKRRREESFEKCDTSEVKVVWETGQQS